MLNIRTALFSIFTTLSLVACSPEQPKTDLVDISKTLAKESKAPVANVGRDPGSVALSDRAYTYVDLTPEKLDGKQPPYYLDLDIPFDTAVVWTQADIDCDGCDDATKKQRAQKWDLRINGRDISLNTNNIDKSTGATLQGMAATNIRAILQNYQESIDLKKYKILPQAAQIQPKLKVSDLTDGRLGGTLGNASIFRTTKGDRIIYFEIADVNSAASWVLFHVREQVLGKDNAFKPARRLYIKWGKDAIGEGIMQVDELGTIRAWFDFDACFNAENEALCFAGNGDSRLNNSVVAPAPMPNWDVYVQLTLGSWSGAFSLNGGASRDAKNNTEFDAAALYLGQIKDRNRTYYKSLNEIWGFSSMQEFWFNAEDKADRYAQTGLGTDGKNAFYTSMWYQIEQRNNAEQTDEPIQVRAIPNRRIYMLETTKNEGLLFQVTGVDKLGGITQVAYKGGKVKQPRSFKIKFRQSEKGIIKYDIPSNAPNANPVIALDAEIVDAETGQRLSEDEFKQVKIFIRRQFNQNLEIETYQLQTISADESQRMRRTATVNGQQQTYSTPAGDYQAVFNVPTTCLTIGGVNYPRNYEILARLPGEELQTWQIETNVCR